MEKKEIVHYLNFDLIIVDSGILLVSKLNLDWPFVIINNDKFGLVVLHSNEVSYGRMHLQWELLDMKSMATYAAEMEEGERWVVAIPFFDATLLPASHLPGVTMHLYKEFRESDFPMHFEKYGSLSVVTGFRE